MEFDKELDRLANHYASRGFTVSIRPNPEQLPTFARDFQVEIVGTRKDGGVLVAVKKNREQLAADPELARYAEVTSQQSGWTFDLAVLESEGPRLEDINQAAELPAADISRQFDDSARMVDLGYARPALVTAWAGFEAAMRLRLRAAGEQAGWGSNPQSLLRELYSNGILDGEEFKRLETLYRVRNQIVHGFLDSLSSEGGAVAFLRELGDRLIAESQLEPVAMG